MTPTLLNACLDSSPGRCALRRLRQVILCGETVTDVIAARARQALPEVELYNLYSIAECETLPWGTCMVTGAWRSLTLPKCALRKSMARWRGFVRELV